MLTQIDKGYQLRLYPNKTQTSQFIAFKGQCRWLWNKFVELNEQLYKEKGKFYFKYELQDLIPKLKEQYTWLKEAPAVSLQRVAFYYDKSLSKAIKDKTRKTGFPSYHKRNNFESFYITNQAFDIDNNKIIIPKIKPIKFKVGQLPEGKIMGAVIKQSGEQWYCSVHTRQEEDIPQAEFNEDLVLGIDLGLTNIITDHNGASVINPKPLKKASKRISRLQRQASRAKKGSNNRKKKNNLVHRVHRKIANQRKDNTHKLTTNIINGIYKGESRTKTPYICVEDPNISGMMKNHKVAQSFADANWYEILRQLAYKAKYTGGKLVKIDRFAPSSQICSCCGHKQPMPLDKDHEYYKCSICDLYLHRDHNAAINIRKWGIDLLKELFKIGRGAPKFTPV